MAGVASRGDFGDVDMAAKGLRPFPVLERGGLIWAVLDPSSTIDIEAFLSGYDDMLSHFNFDKWYLFDSRVLRGPNWKVAYDGYLDFYHLPILHGETFPGVSNKAQYYAWGPHQRVTTPAGLGLQPRDGIHRTVAAVVEQPADAMGVEHGEQALHHCAAIVTRQVEAARAEGAARRTCQPFQGGGIERGGEERIAGYKHHDEIK